MEYKLKKDDIFLNISANSKEEAIIFTGQKLFENGYVEKEYIHAMIEREKEMTTFMGMGFALPHGTNSAKKYVKKSGIVILQFPEGVDFDGEKAYILVGIAGVGDEHLEILSKIAIILDDDLTEKLKNENDINIFLDTFSVM